MLTPSSKIPLNRTKKKFILSNEYKCFVKSFENIVERDITNNNTTFGELNQKIFFI